MINNIYASIISDTSYYIISGFLVLIVLSGLVLMSKVKTARGGNLISGLALLLGVVVSLIKYEIFSIWAIYLFIVIGAIIGLVVAYRVKMINMPQLIALLNSFGGLVSAIVGSYAILQIGGDGSNFSLITAIIALTVGAITFTGSIVATLKLQGLISQKRVVFKFHNFWTLLALLIIISISLFQFVFGYNIIITLIVVSFFSLYLGISLALPIGGADMPVAISLLNSLSGVAGAISGLAIGDALLVAVGGVVGASGLLLTQIMSKAMNRKLADILFTKSKKDSSSKPTDQAVKTEKVSEVDYLNVLKDALDIIIVPGYGMAVAQAQHHVKTLTSLLTANGIKVRFGIHPVAGRMPGHMNVLLAEARIDYDLLLEAEQINDDFKNADLTIVIGANDVINPAARTAVGTPLYGMPILNVDECKNVFIFNYDLKPGYSGVDNPLYDDVEHVKLFLGNAFDTLKVLIEEYKSLK